MKAYKYRGGIGAFDKDKQSIFERDITTLFENKIYAPNKDGLNDPTENLVNDESLNSFIDMKATGSDNAEIVLSAYGSFCKRISESGIYSLSKNYTNELLWAYYGGGHAGFCIEYNVDTMVESVNYNQYLKLAFKFDVSYKTNIPMIRTNKIGKLLKDVDLMIKTYAGTKSKVWRHEDELRLIFDKSGIIEMDYRAVTGIYFGCRMGDAEIDAIMEGLKGRGVKYYKMEFETGSYKLKRVVIKDKYSTSPIYVANSSVKCADWFLSENFMRATYRYKDKLIEALGIVKQQPLITEIYQGIVTEDIPPVFKIFAYTGNKLTPVKKFAFTLDCEGGLKKININ